MGIDQIKTPREAIDVGREIYWERVECAAAAILGSGCTIRAAIEIAEELIATIDRIRAEEARK